MSAPAQAKVRQPAAINNFRVRMGTTTACMCAGQGVPAESAPAEVAVDQLQREACRDCPRAAWTAGQLSCCGNLHHANSFCTSAAQAAC